MQPPRVSGRHYIRPGKNFFHKCDLVFVNRAASVALFFVCPACKHIQRIVIHPSRLMGGKTNAKPSALLATAGCEGRLSKLTEHSVGLYATGR